MFLVFRLSVNVESEYRFFGLGFGFLVRNEFIFRLSGNFLVVNRFNVVFK